MELSRLDQRQTPAWDISLRRPSRHRQSSLHVHAFNSTVLASPAPLPPSPSSVLFWSSRPRDDACLRPNPHSRCAPSTILICHMAFLRATDEDVVEGNVDKLDDIADGTHDCLREVSKLAAVKERARGRKWNVLRKPTPTACEILRNSLRSAASHSCQLLHRGTGSAGGHSRFCDLLMNWMPSRRNSRGTSRISCNWSAIVKEGCGELRWMAMRCV